MAGFILFRAGMKSALTLYLPTYLIGKGESLGFAGISLSVLQLTGAAGTFGAGYISDKIGFELTYKIFALLAFLSLPFVFILPKKN
jgi:FSR family fosmidomycin resistance protein-like MFS transporter